MVYLDLEEIDRVLGLTRFWSRSRWRPARFRREDYLTRGDLSLHESVRQCAEEQTGHRPEGPIRMLTHLRYYGYIFNPVTFYYCFDRDGGLETIVSEITNTPWGERHAYALRLADASPAGVEQCVHRWRFDKDFHVSPFLPMEIDYDWSFSDPGESLFVHMNLRDQTGQSKVFDATLQMTRRPMTAGRLRMLLVRFPFMTLRVIARIHFEALRLWLKRATVHSHPKSGSASTPMPKGRHA